MKSPIFTSCHVCRRSTLVPNPASIYLLPERCCAQCELPRTELKPQEHLRRHSGEKRFACLVCNKAYSGSLDLRRHLARHHPSVGSRIRPNEPLTPQVVTTRTPGNIVGRILFRNCVLRFRAAKHPISATLEKKLRFTRQCHGLQMNFPSDHCQHQPRDQRQRRGRHRRQPGARLYLGHRGGSGKHFILSFPIVVKNLILNSE